VAPRFDCIHDTDATTTPTVKITHQKVEAEVPTFLATGAAHAVGLQPPFFAVVVATRENGDVVVGRKLVEVEGHYPAFAFRMNI
jgi:hypothetical protein